MHYVERAGVIPIAYVDPHTLLLCLGVYTESGDMSDFGGKVEIGESKVQAAARELCEESLGAIDLTPQYVRDNTIYAGSSGFCTVYFVTMPLPELVTFPAKFAQEYAKISPVDSEMEAIKLMFMCDVERACEAQKVYYIVADIIREFIASMEISPSKADGRDIGDKDT